MIWNDDINTTAQNSENIKKMLAMAGLLCGWYEKTN